MSDEDQKIKKWAQKWVSRTKCKKTRKDVDKDLDWQYIVYKYKQAKKKFPDLCINYSDPNHATVDRIDSSKNYQKRNISIIPFWLNCAKNKFSEDEIESVIINYVNKILLEIEE